MSLDWNWFFAAFAQCGAALIGIISAFIISKLLGENEKFESISNKLDSLILTRSYLLDKISVCRFAWYDKLSIEYSSNVRKAIREGDFENLTDEQKIEKLFELDQSLFQSENCLDYLNETIKETPSKYMNTGGGFSVSLPDFHIPPKGLTEKLSAEKEKVINLRIECTLLIKKFNAIKHELSATKSNLTPIKNTIYILSIGLIITVIYPLHFMPLKIDTLPTIGFSTEIFLSNILSIKGFLLISLATIIEGIFLYFLKITIKTEALYSKTINSIQSSWTRINGYSNYFE